MPDSLTPFIVLIPTSGKRPDLLERALASLTVCSKPENFEGVWVVENGIQNLNKRKIVDAYKNIGLKYLFTQKPNKSAALNYALSKLKRNTFIYFADDDVRFKKDILIKYASEAKYKPLYYFGGPVEVDYERKPQEWLLKYLPPSAKGWEADHNEPGYRYLGMNWGAFSDHVKRVGLFDQNKGPGSLTTGQEHDMQTRLYKAGFKPHYIPDAKVWHYVPIERCSEEFALLRRYKKGIQHGINNKRTPSRNKILGIPVNFIRKTAKIYLKMLIYKMHASKIEKFEYKFALKYQLGLIKGFLVQDRINNNFENPDYK